MQRPLRYVFLEALLIAVGVVVALFAQEWRETQQAERVTTRALERIRDEIVLNRELVQDASNYHNGRSEYLMGFLRAGDGSVPEPREFPRHHQDSRPAARVSSRP